MFSNAHPALTRFDMNNKFVTLWQNACNTFGLRGNYEDKPHTLCTKIICLEIMSYHVGLFVPVVSSFAVKTYCVKREMFRFKFFTNC